jgi:hypothetical protein
MNVKDLLMDGDDDESLTDAEVLEKRRRQFEGLKTVMEGKRAVLEAKGMDVDAALAELNAHWAAYEASQQEVDRKEEECLQKLADMADARENLMQLFRDGLSEWQEALEKAPAGSSERVAVWEGFTAWKAQMRDDLKQWLAEAGESEAMQSGYDEALKLLED